MKYLLGGLAAVGFILLLSWSDDIPILLLTKVIGVLMCAPLFYFGRRWEDDDVD